MVRGRQSTQHQSADSDTLIGGLKTQPEREIGKFDPAAPHT